MRQLLSNGSVTTSPLQRIGTIEEMGAVFSMRPVPMLYNENKSENFKRQARTLIREGASHQQIRNCLTVIKIWSRAPGGYLTPVLKLDS
jgi:hypothetical protein